MQMGVYMNEEGNFTLRRNRRGFLIRAGAVLGTGALAVFFGRSARASGLPPVSLTDAAAKKLRYTDDASKIDRSSNPSYVPGSKCASCSFFHGSGGFGTCSFFPGKAVNANGWCSAYAKPDDSW